MKRITVLTGILAMALALAPANGSAATTTAATLSCSNGDSVVLGLDALSLADLSLAITDLNTNAFALSCTLTQGDLSLLASDPSSGDHDMVAGGGSIFFGGSSSECDNQVAVSAHTDVNGVHGQLEQTVPASSTCQSQGHYTAQVTCLLVNTPNPGDAQVEAKVINSEGSFTVFAPVGTYVRASFADDEVSGTDRFGPGGDSAVQRGCDPTGDPFLPLENGHFNVRD